jgi:hypothetical protein
VWLPNVPSGFIPYSTNGYWIFTEDGWTWVSDYSWGWAPFHYGRWFNDDMYGPMWVPDYDWGPAWVTWRRSSGYYGWAPMGPGISISIAFGIGYNERFNHYTFVEDRYFGRRDMRHHYMRYSDHDRNFNNSTGIDNIRSDRRHSDVRYHGGPDRGDVEKRSGKRVNPITVKELNNPGQSLNKKELQIYRPRVQKNAPNGVAPVPSQVRDAKDINQSVKSPTISPIRKVVPQSDIKQNKQLQTRPNNNKRIEQKLSPNQDIKPKTEQETKQNQPSRSPVIRQERKMEQKQPIQVVPQKKVEQIKQPQNVRKESPTQQQKSQPKEQKEKQSKQVVPQNRVERIRQPQQTSPQKRELKQQQPQRNNAPKRVERQQRPNPPKRNEGNGAKPQETPKGNAQQQKPPHQDVF